MTKSNFFDAIGVADMEKVHSAVIGWMLSDKCEAFGKGDPGRKIRSELLQKIFGIQQDFEHFDSIDSMLEWKNIDILVVTTGDEKKKCWVIENKIKSSQHSNQLNRYVDTVNCEYLLSSSEYKEICTKRDAVINETEYIDETEINKYINGFQRKGKTKNEYFKVEKHYCFLTLIKEKPICSRPGIKWENTDYSLLSQFLKEALKLNPGGGKDHIVLTEYNNCIEEITSALNEFLLNHLDYQNVFTDGWKQKYEKPTNYVGRQKYISDNGLETIFQKCFLSFIVPKTNFKCFKAIDVSETHGTALVNFPYATSGDTKYGFQFQNGTFKIQIVKEYVGTREENEKNIKAFLQKWDKFIPTDKNTSRCSVFNDWYKNKSHENKKAYISICKKNRPRNSKRNQQTPWYAYHLKDILSNWNDAYDEYMSMMKKVVILESGGI